MRNDGRHDDVTGNFVLGLRYTVRSIFSDVIKLNLFTIFTASKIYYIQDEPYPMKLPKLGHAVIINNIASEIPGSYEDVKALKEAYKTVGFDVQVHENLTEQVLTP